MKKLNAKYFGIAISIATILPNNALSMEIRQMHAHDLVENECNQDISPTYDCKYLKNLTTKNITPENTVFAFDLHEVLFNRHRSMMVWGGFKLFCKSFFYMLFHPLFVCRLISVSHQPMVCEGMFVKLAEEYPYAKRWERDIFEISNGCCYPEWPMLNLLKILKQKGFKIFLLSNIGADTLVDFRKRFDCIEDLFDGFYTPSRANSYSYKPMLNFYEGFKQYLGSLDYADKQILFIDDIERNIVCASHVGIAGIHFVGYENLCNTLNALGIAVNAADSGAVII